MQPHRIVSQEEWLVARKAHLAKEKELTRLRDRLSAERRELPWVKVEKAYVFDGPDGQETLAELFGGKSQLLVYHFMLGPEWEEGCRSCSFSPITSTARTCTCRSATSRCSRSRARRSPGSRRSGDAWAGASNGCRPTAATSTTTSTSRSRRKSWRTARSTTTTTWSKAHDELPGLSAFYKDENGDVFHTYSAYARGLDMLIGAYNYLDLAPKGRDEAALPWTMAWVRHHDRYEDQPAGQPSAA